MFGVVEDLLLGSAQLGSRAARLTSAGVAVEAREGAAGDLHADAVVAPETVGGGPQPNDRPGDLVRSGDARQAVADVGRAAVDVDIAEAYEDIGVRQAGAEEDLGADL